MKSTISPLVTDEKLQQALGKIEQLGSSYSGLSAAIGHYRHSAADVRHEYEWQSWKSFDTPTGDPLTSIHTLLLSLAWDLRAIQHLIVFDVDQLLESVDTGLATRSFRQVVLGVRAILERAAITESHLTSMRASFNEICDFPSRQFMKVACTRFG
jgi:hypothetical protein